MLSIQTNVNSMNAQENLRNTNLFQGRTIARLTSGYRINESGDDAAGLAIANKYRSDVTELMQGVRNANDGLSTLQIIDGGLNNISKMLDRLKTLATQSASATFTGNRDTLNQEYKDQLTEIDRQAANIGLGQGDTNAGRNNYDIQVFIGGGSASANSMIGVDLEGAASLVDSKSLFLDTTDISGTRGGTLFLNLDADANPATPVKADYLKSDASQVLHVATATTQRDITIVGSNAGLSGSDIVSQLNEKLSGMGVRASLSTDGSQISLTSDGGFVITAENGGADEVFNDANTLVSDQLWSTKAGITVANSANTDAQDLVTHTFTIAGKSYNVSLANGDTKDQVFDKLRAGLAGSGIEVIRQGDDAFFQASAKFSMTSADADTDGDSTTGVSSGGLGGAAAAIDSTLPTDDVQYKSTAVIDPTQNALAALDAINKAVSSLGKVQGTIGTGQNRLSYAIQLAQSQITSFSAAESRIRDADVAAEAANLTKAQVLQQASLAALAQANSAPQAVLSLLRG